MVKSHANTAVFSLTANSPNTHVSPNRGSRIRDAFSRLLLLLLLLLLMMLMLLNVPIVWENKEILFPWDITINITSTIDIIFDY